MTAVETLIQKLTDAGMTPVEAMALVARAGAELSAPVVSKGALRTRRWRENRASQTVTERHAVTVLTDDPRPSPSVTDRHKPSPRDGAYISLKEDKGLRKEEKREARPSRLSSDWTPSESDLEVALRKGLPRERIPAVAEKFKNHWLSKGGKNATAVNWHLKWCTWVMNELEWNGGAAPKGTTNAPENQRGNLIAVARRAASDAARAAGMVDDAGEPVLRVVSQG